MDPNDGIFTFLMPNMYDAKNDNILKNKSHNDAYDNILKLSDNSLFSYTDDYGTKIFNGLCVDDDTPRYCIKGTDRQLYPISQTIMGDVISSIRI